MHEIATIQALRALFPVTPRQHNDVLTCDAELFQMGDMLFGISMDDFSHEEDAFPDTDLSLLGWNLAVATLSDLLAAGCTPQFFLHSIVEPTMPERAEFALGIAHGIQEALAMAGCHLLGGDMGRAASWRYTGVALGSCPGGTGRTRLIPSKRQQLWITGTVGDGNLCALDARATTRFELRVPEAKAIEGVATACMDTSGGLAESLMLLACVNPRHAFHIETSRLPFGQSIRDAAQATGLPVEGFAFGGAGEYELLFTTDEGAVVDCATPIGIVFPAEIPGVYWNERLMPCALPDARAFTQRADYVHELLKVVSACLYS